MVGKRGGGMLDADILKRIYCQPHAVFRSCSLISETHFSKVWREWVTIITRYDAIYSTWLSHFFKKIQINLNFEINPR